MAPRRNAPPSGVVTAAPGADVFTAGNLADRGFSAGGLKKRLAALRRDALRLRGRRGAPGRTTFGSRPPAVDAVSDGWSSGGVSSGGAISDGGSSGGALSGAARSVGVSSDSSLSDGSMAGGSMDDGSLAGAAACGSLSSRARASGPPSPRAEISPRASACLRRRTAATASDADKPELRAAGAPGSLLSGGGSSSLVTGGSRSLAPFWAGFTDK